MYVCFFLSFLRGSWYPSRSWKFDSLEVIWCRRLFEVEGETETNGSTGPEVSNFFADWEVDEEWLSKPNAQWTPNMVPDARQV